MHWLLVNGNKEDLGERFNKSEIKGQNKDFINNWKIVKSELRFDLW